MPCKSQLNAHPERLPTLRQLSGGNPRTTVMFYELLATAHTATCAVIWKRCWTP